MSYYNSKSTSKVFTILSGMLWLASTLVLFAQIKGEEFQPFMFSLEVNDVPKIKLNTKLEIEAIIIAQNGVNDSLLQEIRYWNAAYPSYRWHQIMEVAGNRSKDHKNGGRMAILHLAIYDALAEVWKQKQKTKTKAPSQEHKSIKKWAEPTVYSSFICERSTVAAAAHKIILYYFPEQQMYLDSILQQYKTARLLTGLQYPSDMEMGILIGQKMAEKYIAYAKTDRTDELWAGSLPNDKTLWSGKPNNWDPMKRQWRPFTLQSADQYRPAPPPKDWTAEMEELREFTKNNESSAIAWKWQSEPIFDLLLERKILEYDLDPFEAAQASALFHMVRFDATIAAWDGKYHYWGIRPFQYDPSFKPMLIETPNFPGYPAGHTTVAGGLVIALSHLFPKDTAHFQALAEECSESRFEGGVHFRTDNEVGLEVGKMVGAQVIKKFYK